MRTSLLLATVLAVMLAPGFTALAVDWTSMVSPASLGIYTDVIVEDLNKDGINDVLAAKGHDEETAIVDGLPLWFGQSYTSGNRWFWALSNLGSPTGPSATEPLAGPTNVGDGIIQNVSIGNAFIDVEDWVATCISPTEVDYIIYGKLNGQPNDGDCTLDPDVTITEMLVNDNEVWTCVYNESGGYWKITSPRTGQQDTNAYTDQWYTSDHDEVTFRINSGGTPPGNNDAIRYYLKKARFEVSSARGKLLSSDPAEYTPPVVDAYFTDWRPIMGFRISSGPVNFVTGDYFTFAVPNGPLTTDKYEKVVCVDINQDSFKDIAAVGEHGVKAFLQNGPVVGPVIFHPKPVAHIPLGQGTLTVIGLDNTATLTETWYVTMVDAYNFTVSGSVSGNLSSGEVSETYFADYGQVIFNVEGTMNGGDQFVFATFRTTWTENRGPDISDPYVSLAAADLNYDAKPDLVAGRAAGGIDMWMNGGGSWTNYTGPSNVGVFEALALKDMDKDGRVDLVGCADNQGIKVWEYLGGGAWSAATTPATSGSYESLRVVDINNDGNTDIVAASKERGLYVWYQQEDGSWFQKSWASMPEPGAHNQGTGGMSAVNTDNEVTITEGWRVECLEEAFRGGIFKVVGDISGEQTARAVVGQIYTSDDGAVQFELLAGTVDFKVGDYFTFITGRGPLSNHRFHDLDSGDLDSDGKADIFASSADESGVLVWTGNAVYGWNLETSPISNSEYLAIAASKDLNFDGNPDVVASNASNGGIQVWIGNGTDKYQFHGWIAKPVAYGQFYGVKIAELNNDHKPDIVAANFEVGKDGVWTFYGNGGGDFELGESPTQVSKFYSVDTGDLNQDGYQDIAAGHSTQGVFVWLSNGDGTWGNNVGPVASGSYWDVDIDDINNDGKLDIAGAKDYDGNGGSVQVWLGNGDGTFQAGQSPLTGAIYSFWNVEIADFNQNGVKDLICSGYTGAGGIYWYITSPPGSDELEFSSHGVIFSSSGQDNFYGALTKDFNLDHTPDLVLTEGGSGCMARANTGCSNCPYRWYSSSYFDSGFKQNVASDDINNDGIPDVTVANLGTGISVWRGSFTGPSRPFSFSNLSPPTTNGDYIGVDVADFTNDGLPDIVGGHGVSGGTGIEVWLSERDFTLIRVNGTDPGMEGVYNVGSDLPFKIFCNKELDESTVTISNIQVTQDGIPLYGSIFLSANRKDIYYYPDSTLRANSSIAMTVKSGYEGILDIYGNPLDGDGDGVAEPSPVDDYSVTFTTVDTTPPGIPGEVIAIPEDHGVLIRWRANNETDLEGYWVCWGEKSRFEGNYYYTSEYYYPKEQFGDVVMPEYMVRGLVNGRTYYFAVASQDAAGNYSEYSAEVSGMPAQFAPESFLAGYWGTWINSGLGGNLRLLAWFADPQNDVGVAEVLYAGVPTGVFLADDGTQNDFAAGDGIFGLALPIQPGVPSGVYPLELRATDQEGNVGSIWPYYNCIGSGPVLPGASTPDYARPPVLPPPLWQYGGEIGTPPGPAFPEVAMGGYMGTQASPEMGGPLNLVAFVQDPDGYSDIHYVELYFGGAGTGVYLQDDGANGDFAAGDGIFGLSITIPPYDQLPEGLYLLEVRAVDQDGNPSALWPYLNVY
ncbi:VCBS repeat-containing protein [bacterium]|nr:VCBS repeat-containing protein [candidate division CSSED10-310 bacterium]